MSKFLHSFEIMNAWKNGKPIERECAPGLWREVDLDPHYLELFIACPGNFRVKYENNLRPWRLEEVPVGAQVRFRGSKKVFLITSSYGPVKTSYGLYDTDTLLIHWEWKWGHETEWKPCGVPNE